MSECVVVLALAARTSEKRGKKHGDNNAIAGIPPSALVVVVLLSCREKLGWRLHRRDARCGPGQTQGFSWRPSQDGGNYGIEWRRERERFRQSELE